jgi:hypothetical protein
MDFHRYTTSDKAWMTLGAAILAYEIWAPDGELLSEAVDRYLITHPIATKVITMTLVLHILNVVQPDYDPIHHLATVLRKGRNYGPSKLGELGRGHRGKPELDRGTTPGLG